MYSTYHAKLGKSIESLKLGPVLLHCMGYGFSNTCQIFAKHGDVISDGIGLVLLGSLIPPVYS